MGVWIRFLETVGQDFRFALRLLARQPSFSLTVVVILALGIGANTTIFAWINATLLTPVPGAGDTRGLVALARQVDRSAASYLDYLEFRESNRSFSELIAFQDMWSAITGNGVPERVYASVVSANYFDALGATPVLGRGFLPAEERDEGAGAVAVLGHHLWTDRFAADPDVVGRTVELDRQVYTVVGVAPPRFQGTKTAVRSDVWVPLSRANAISGGEHLRDRGDLWFNVIGRLRPGVDRRQAQDEVNGWAAAKAVEVGGDHGQGASITLHPLWSSPIGGNALLADVLGPLLVAALAVLILACTNVANLMLVRSLTRGRELAIRAAVGAGPGRIQRQILVESTMLALAAGVAAFLVTLGSGGALRHFFPPVNLPLEIGVRPDGRVLLAAFGFALLAGGVIGLVPAIRASGVSPSAVMKDEPAGGIGKVLRSPLVGAFVVVQVALSVVLLTGAGLLARSVDNARRADPGFDAERVLVATVDFLSGSYSQRQGISVMQQILKRVEALPGVESATIADWVPLSFARHTSVVEPEHYEPRRSESMEVARADVGPRYFQTLGIPLVAGRDFLLMDGPDAPPVAVVNRAFAERYWPGLDPVGRRVRANGLERTVVGVARNARYYSWTEAELPFLYLPQLQHYYHEATIHVRATGAPLELAPDLVRTIRDVDPNLPVYLVTTLAEQSRSAGFLGRLAATTGTLFGLLALGLATIGVYGVVAQATRQRTREIGLRIALGADSQRVLRLILRQGLVLTAIGIVIGLLAALGLTRFLGSQLVGVHRYDPVTFAAVTVLIGGVSLLACYLPGRRAAGLDAAQALRTR